MAGARVTGRGRTVAARAALSAADVRSDGAGSDVCVEGANWVPLVERTPTVKYMILTFASQQQRYLNQQITRLQASPGTAR